jgi:hypothetical protein
MNPPFGVSGKTAMEHLINHGKYRPRHGLDAFVLPGGPSMELDRIQDLWIKGADFAILTQIRLPNCTFERQEHH